MKKLKQILIPFLVLCTLGACKKDEKSLDEKIIGKWQIDHKLKGEDVIPLEQCEALWALTFKEAEYIQDYYTGVDCETHHQIMEWYTIDSGDVLNLKQPNTDLYNYFYIVRISDSEMVLKNANDVYVFTSID